MRYTCCSPKTRCPKKQKNIHIAYDDMIKHSIRDDANNYLTFLGIKIDIFI